MTDGFAELDTVALCRDLPDAGGRGMYQYETARTENDKVPAASGKQPAASFTATDPSSRATCPDAMGPGAVKLAALSFQLKAPR